MASSTLFPTVTTTTSGGSETANDWTDPSNVNANDGSNASITAATYDAGDVSFRLYSRTFGFAIPVGATINGIEVHIERFCDAGAAEDFRVQLVDGDGFIVGTNKADTVTAWPGTATLVTYGDSTDLWGLTTTEWTPTVINDTAFGVAVSAAATANNTDVHVDYIQITVHYTPAEGGAVPETYYYRSTGQGAHYG